ncbi:MAG: hypothetical protein QF724_04640 [Planctomycetota bacterium]|nr:hypothetical protein [Planctomycetota bacterium]MDP6368192.1 hypothetical protein [Planctomycetota bacterium]MDP6521041.1 hypothetical protein [Planctomycetota bacterium]MDP6838204.1 hypothetical protein [Planctomycetota bacterium]MDP6954345.1 hypothetical protein [Planctomycetota bacterium]
MALTGLGLLCALLLPGCLGGDGSTDAGEGNQNFSHDNIPLIDRFGEQLTVASTEPYSPRLTCGGCHDVDHIANGYHFQQGRTDLDGNVVVQDNFMADGRGFVRSPGMYGKW